VDVRGHGSNRFHWIAAIDSVHQTSQVHAGECRGNEKITAAYEKAADDQIAHAHQVERAYISGGGAPIGDRAVTKDGITKAVPLFQLDINNYGKTPGKLLEYGIGWCEIDEVPNLPTRPEYEWHFFRDMIQPGRPSRPIAHLLIPIKDIPSAVIFGRFGYRDIFGQPHSDGFIQHGGKPIQASPRFLY
jgi:hypothetical protein